MVFLYAAVKLMMALCETIEPIYLTKCKKGKHRISSKK